MQTTIQGFGLGLRTEHYATLIDEKPALDWLEIISENYMVPGGKPLHYLDTIRQDYPMVMHGVSLSIGSTDPINFTYLKELKKLLQRVEPGWISDHLCWTGVNHTNLHDLLPLPYTEAALNHLATRIQQVQDYLGQRILLENVSSYITYQADQMTEWEFIKELSQRADCLLLLDINNVYVSSVNHGFNPQTFIDALPTERIRQIHLAGHEDHGDYIIDTHDQPISNPVWQLYDYAIQQLGAIPTMIERDDNIPPLAELMTELAQARQIATRHTQLAA